MPLRIMIADDHGVLRAGLRALLNDVADLSVVGEASTGDEALRLAADLKPDVILMDLSMPGLGGIETTRRLKETLPEARVLILTVHEDAELLREAIRAGACGYVVKRAVESELLTAIQAVQRGDVYVHPSMTRALLDERTPARVTPSTERPDVLTGREVDVLRRIVRGYTNRQIADELFLSIRTVETHRANLMGKLGLSSRAEVVRWAMNHHLAD